MLLFRFWRISFLFKKVNCNLSLITFLTLITYILKKVYYSAFSTDSNERTRWEKLYIIFYIAYSQGRHLGGGKGRGAIAPPAF